MHLVAIAGYGPLTTGPQILEMSVIDAGFRRGRVEPARKTRRPGQGIPRRGPG